MTDDLLIAELQRHAATTYPLCPEARLLLEMAVETQQGKPIDLTRLRTLGLWTDGKEPT